MHRLKKTSRRSIGGGGEMAGATLPISHVIYVIDDDSWIRDGVRDLCRGEGYGVETFCDCETFLEAYRPQGVACLLVDAYLPGMSGIELLELMGRHGLALPSIVITGRGDVPTAVTAMRAGALDYVQKPVDSTKLLALIARAFTRSVAAGIERTLHDDASVKISSLTPRQHQIMLLVLAGHPSKNIAVDLGISRRTVENHRASIMKRTGSGSLPALARLAMSGGPRRIGISI